MNDIDFAYVVSETAHKNQKYNGRPYALHIHDVQLMVSKLPIKKALMKKCRVVAIMHDAFEDGKVFSLNDMISCYNDDIVDALDAITKRDDEKYLDYINRVLQNKIATIVKLCDMTINYTNARKDNKTKLISKYLKDWAVLSDNKTVKEIIAKSTLQWEV